MEIEAEDIIYEFTHKIKVDRVYKPIEKHEFVKEGLISMNMLVKIY